MVKMIMKVMTSMMTALQEHLHYSDAIWIPTLATLGQGLFMTLSGHLEDRLGVRMTVLLGSCFMTSGVFLTYFTIQHSLFLTTVTYGLMFGFGTALAYAPPMAVAMRWFPRYFSNINFYFYTFFVPGRRASSTASSSVVSGWAPSSSTPSRRVS